MLHRIQFIKLFFFFCIALFQSNRSTAQNLLRIELKGKPGSHLKDSLYIAGSFNGWNPGVNTYSFKTSAEGIQYAEIKDIPSGIVEYKITRGSWATVEAAKNGAAISNRILQIKSDTTISISIEAWADDFPGRPPVSTRSKNVFVIDTSFSIPQLNRKRRIWVYLPEDYAFSKKKYPVLYMHDGQNLFDVQTSSYGEWGVDEMMDSIRPARQCIIVGIDHGDAKRMTEYNPYTSRFGPGEGDAYVDFLVNTLKPYIDKTFRTRPSKESTFTAGSSMGGLISLYAVVKYPSVFGAAGVFSPAFWIAPDLKKKIDSSSNLNSAVYFVCGELEGKEMVTDMKSVYDQLKQKGLKKLYYKQVKEGRHNENFWRSEMYDFYRWLFINQIK